MTDMARRPRIAPGGWIYHVLNRTAGRFDMLRRSSDYEALSRVVVEAHRRIPMRILSYCMMSNHWHFVAWPEHDGQLTEFFRWMTHTHAMRWRVSHNTVGYGHLYQGRFKSFPVQQDGHFLNVCRYVERNALTAGIVAKAEDWRWSSLWARSHEDDPLRVVLSPWPVQRPDNWGRQVNEAWSEKELEKLRQSLKRDRPFGSDTWIARSSARLGLTHTLRSEGRPGKTVKRIDKN
jgi:putative transposase